MKKINNILLLLLTAFAVVSCSEVFDSGWKGSDKSKGLSISTTSFNFKASTDLSSTTQVTSDNVSWQITNLGNWGLAMSPTEGSSSATVSVSVPENKKDETFSASPEFRSTDENYPARYTMSVKQEQADAELDVPNSETMVVEPNGTTKTISVTSNYPVTFSKDKDWITVESSKVDWADVSTRTTTFTIKVAQNSGDDGRTGDIVFTAKSASGNKSIAKTLNISQQAANVTSKIATLGFGNTAETKKITFDSNADWTVVSDASNKDGISWVTVSPEKGSKGENISVNVSVTDNPGETTREGFVYIKIGNSIKKEIVVTQDGVVVEVQGTEMSFDAAGGSNTFNIKANSTWTVRTTNDSWIKVNKTSGSNNATITVNVTANSGENRTGSVEVYNKYNTKVGSIAVSQASGEQKIFWDGDPLTFPLNGGDPQSIKIHGNGSWHLETDQSWITINPSSGTVSGMITVQVSVTKNNTANTRTGHIYLYDSNNNKIDNYVTVFQSTFQIKPSESKIDFEPEGNKLQFNIEADDNSEWVLRTPDWITVNPTKGTGNTMISATSSENTTGSKRTGNIEIIADLSGAVAVSIPVSQEAIQLSVTDKTAEYAVAGGTKSFKVTSNLSSWTATSDASWLTLTNPSGKENGTFTATATENIGSAARTATITIKSASGNSTATVRVTQIGSSISVSPSSLTFPVDGSTESIKITSNTKWSLSTSLSWIKLGTTSGSSDATVTVTAEKNPNSSVREGSILLKNSQGTTIQTISVKQVASALSVTPDNFTIKAAGSTETLKVTANSSWSLVPSQSWITITPSSGSGNNANVSVKFSQNTSTTSRTGTIKLRNAGNQDIQTINISQEAYTLSVSPTQFNLKATESTQPFTVTANSSWTASSDASWLTLKSKSGTGNGTVNFTVTENNSDAKRTATITIVCGIVTKTITVSQDFIEKLSVNPTSLSFPTTSSSQTINIYSNSSWELSQKETWLSLSRSYGTGNATITVTADTNPLMSVRSGNITFKNNSGTTASVTVTQTAMSISATMSAKSFAYDGGTATIDIKANSGWKIVAPSWVSLSSSSGTGDAKVTVYVSENTSSQNRYGTIEVQTTAGSKQASFDIQQSGRTDTEGTHNLNHTFHSAGESYTMSPIKSNTWTAEVTSGSNWITISPTSGNSKTDLRITVADNPSGKSREGAIKVRYTSNVGYDYITVPVKQAGKTLSVNAASAQFFAKGGTSGAITVTADKNPTVTSSASWLTVNQSGKSFTLTAAKNTTNSKRTATVTITLPGVTDSPSATVSVTQAGVNGTFTISGFGSDENWN